MTYEEYSTLAMDTQETTYCYISDPETYELLYVNKKGQEVLGLPNGTPHGKCYQLIQGKDAPCDFCTNSRLVPGRFHHWEYYNSKLGHHLALQDTLIEWKGKKLRLELGIDITERKQTEETLNEYRTWEETLLRCVQTLTEEKDMQRAVDTLLSIVGEYYNSNRAYIFEFNTATGNMDNTYEWCKTGVPSAMAHLQGLPLEYARGWLERFQADGILTITSLKAELVPHSPEYQILEPQGIQTLMAVPLISKGEIIGFLGVDDPVSNMDDERLLRSVPLFVQADLEKRRMLAELERMSYIDALTGLYNRNKYMTELHILENKHPAPIGIVYLDINGLKAVNDTYGHSYGDRLIIKTADLLHDLFGSNVFRIGGDEFVALYYGQERQRFEETVEKLHKMTEAKQDFNISIGCTWVDGSQDIAKQVTYADKLMYQNKQNYYKSLLNGAMLHHSGMAQALQDDIKAGAFVVYLQAQVSPQDGSIIGAEAMVRRKGIPSGLLPPAKFIPLYEANGIIRHLDFFVLETVCASLVEGKQKGIALPISVNLSSITLMEHNIVPTIKNLCKKYGVEPALLRLEVRKSISTMEANALEKLIRRFHDEGFSISLGDFSFENSNMDFNEIKFGKNLAEGMEIETQKDIRPLGQGNLLSRPMFPHEFWHSYRKQRKAET